VVGKLVRIAEAEKAIAATQSTTMTNVNGIAGETARAVPRRPQQLGKFSQPIETKWADFAPVGKKAVRNQCRARDSCTAAKRDLIPIVARRGQNLEPCSPQRV
jgi:hypothetical protein